MRRSGATILTAVAVGITVVVLWVQKHPVAVRQATPADVVAEARRGGYGLIETQRLWDLYRKNPDGLLIVDTRQQWEYRTGHIRDAVNFPMEPTRWARWRKKGALARFLGPDRRRIIVFY